MAVEWQDNSDVFSVQQTAETDNGCSLAVFSVCGGSNTETNPYGWSVTADHRELDGGPAPTLAEGRRQAEKTAAAYRRPAKSNDAKWDDADAASRKATRRRFETEGWQMCDHDDCPPWNCRVTNPVAS